MEKRLKKGIEQELQEQIKFNVFPNICIKVSRKELEERAILNGKMPRRVKEKFGLEGDEVIYSI